MTQGLSSGVLGVGLGRRSGGAEGPRSSARLAALEAERSPHDDRATRQAGVGQADEEIGKRQPGRRPDQRAVRSRYWGSPMDQLHHSLLKGSESISNESKPPPSRGAPRSFALRAHTRESLRNHQFRLIQPGLGGFVPTPMP